MQYAGYAAYDPGRVRILAPGSDLARFASARPSRRVEAAIDRFLTDPGKPALLARANLVVVAGTREDIDALDGGMAANVSEDLASHAGLAHSYVTRARGVIEGVAHFRGAGLPAGETGQANDA